MILLFFVYSVVIVTMLFLFVGLNYLDHFSNEFLHNLVDLCFFFFFTFTLNYFFQLPNGPT
jgi:hypothetical protein